MNTITKAVKDEFQRQFAIYSEKQDKKYKQLASEIASMSSKLDKVIEKAEQDEAILTSSVTFNDGWSSWPISSYDELVEFEAKMSGDSGAALKMVCLFSYFV